MKLYKFKPMNFFHRNETRIRTVGCPNTCVEGGSVRFRPQRGSFADRAYKQIDKEAASLYHAWAEKYTLENIHWTER